MNTVLMMVILLAAVFASFKMAEEKGQNKFVWSVITLLVGPLVVILQYLVAYFTKKKTNKVCL